MFDYDDESYYCDECGGRHQPEIGWGGCTKANAAANRKYLSDLYDEQEAKRKREGDAFIERQRQSREEHKKLVDRQLAGLWFEDLVSGEYNRMIHDVLGEISTYQNNGWTYIRCKAKVVDDLLEIDYHNTMQMNFHVKLLANEKVSYKIVNQGNYDAGVVIRTDQLNRFTVMLKYQGMYVPAGFLCAAVDKIFSIKNKLENYGIVKGGDT